MANLIYSDSIFLRQLSSSFSKPARSSISHMSMSIPNVKYSFPCRRIPSDRIGWRMITLISSEKLDRYLTHIHLLTGFREALASPFHKLYDNNT